MTTEEQDTIDPMHIHININTATICKGRRYYRYLSIRYDNKIMFVLSRRTVSTLTRVLLRCLSPSLPHNSGNKHQNNPLVSVQTVRHSSSYSILYIYLMSPLVFYIDDSKHSIMGIHVNVDLKPIPQGSVHQQESFCTHPANVTK